MKIVVLVKQVPDTYGERRLDETTGRIVRAGVDLVADEIGERALEAALAQKDADPGTEVVVLTMGPASAADVLRRSLAIGADAAVHILDDGLAGADMLRTSAVLAAALRRTEFDLVIAGNESTDGRGGAMAAMLAEQLGLPHATTLVSLGVEAGAVTGQRVTENGMQDVRADLPALVSVTEGMPEARFPTFKGTMRAKKKPVKTLRIADLDLTEPPAASIVVGVTPRPPRAAGRKVVDDGTAAAELIEYLTAAHLI